MLQTNFTMWSAAAPLHAQSLVSLVQQGLSDCTLVSSLCGGRVSTHRLLLAIHSPLLAGLLGNVGDGVVGLTLPLPLETLRRLVALLQGKPRDVEQEAVTLLHLQLGKTD